MLYEGKAFTALPLEQGIIELRFDLSGESVNKFNQTALDDLAQAITAIEADSTATGVILTSGKPAFIVGADITEFTATFKQAEASLLNQMLAVNTLFSRFEDLAVPTVAAINGVALGGGFEICLCADYRLMTPTARVGLPEVKLGIYPGWGGTVRLPRLIGADNAIDWICTGNEQTAGAALRVGAVDGVVAPDKLREAAVAIVQQCLAGKLDINARRQEKQQPLALTNMEAMMVFETAKPVVASKAGPHYPAPVAVIKTIQQHAYMPRDRALAVEAKGFVKLAKTPVAACLVGLFLNGQYLKRQAKTLAKQAQPVTRAAVVGAGIMGGGIAYQSACKNVPILMKDIQSSCLDLGLQQANTLLAQQIGRGRMNTEDMGNVLSRIVPTLSYGDFNNVDVVIEAVVEDCQVKQAVLAEVEEQVPAHTVLASNTSTIAINALAQSLKRPEQFCGMHFFNPVHRMPLVEVIRGEQTCAETIATVVQYARHIGKTPIVVNDCPGFLVNRVLFPYFAGFTGLLRDGADFQQIDAVMEGFGWPMGPAYLLDVIGIDTCHHATAVMAAGYPDRMSKTAETAIDVLFANKQYGQKTNAGFYHYKEDKQGKRQKHIDDSIYTLLAQTSTGRQTFDEDDIIARMMLPLCLETVRALEEGIVDSAIAADMGLILGIGFPPFRGGALKYMDSNGLSNFVALADRYSADLGPLYQPTDKLRAMAKDHATFYNPA